MRTNNNRKFLTALPFLLPALVIYSSVVIFPTGYSLFLSCFSWGGIGEKKFVGLQNYMELFGQDAVFRTALVNNVKWICLTLIFTVSLSLALALLINHEFKGRVVYRAIFYFPYMLSWIIVGIVWKWMYNPNLGIINSTLRLFGINTARFVWLSDVNIALYCIYAAALWQSVGQPMLLFLSGLQTIPRDIYEAALIDGATNMQTFIYITLPLLKETFVVVLAILVVAAMKVYDIINVMTGGGPANATQTLASYMYSQTFMYSNVGKGSAVASVMFLVTLFIIVPYVLISSKEE